MSFQIIRSDITKIKADAIVNIVNPQPYTGVKTVSAINTAANEELLLVEREKLGKIAPGHAAFMDAVGLNAKYIIHTIGPVWIDGAHEERDILHSCYENSLILAAELKCKSIAFQLIVSGVYDFPRDEALHIALTEINKFLLTHEMKVILVVSDRKALELSEQLINSIEQYIDEHSEYLPQEAVYGGDYARDFFEYKVSGLKETEEPIFDGKPTLPGVINEVGVDETFLPPISTLPDVTNKSLEEVLDKTGETFQQRLFELIDASGMDDVTVYKKANIDRKVFSRIRCNPDYKPKKKTAVAFAIALKLDLPTTLDLLSRAEIAFSPSSKFDLIVSYFITNENYDIFEINAALFKFGQPILGE